MIRKLFVLTSVCLVTFLVLCQFTSTKAAENDFFAVAKDPGANLPADKLYPRGRIFPLTGYSPHNDNIEQLKAAGFTTLGPVYGKEEDYRKMCADNSVKCLYTVRPTIDGEAIDKDKHLSAKDVKPDWEAIRKSLIEKMKPALNDDNVAWWIITPEELRFWKKNEYEYLKLAYKTIRETDPKKRPAYMYTPNHYPQSYLDKLVPYMDILGKGSYTNYASQKNSRIWVRWSMEQEIKAIKKSNPKAIPLMVGEMFQEPTPEEVALIPTWVRHDNYLGLVCGGKGLLIFSLWPRKGFPSHPVYLNAYCDLAKELTGKSGLTDVFLFGKRCNDLKMEIVSGEKETSCTINHKGVKTYTYPSVTFADISWQGRRYLIAVNSSENPVKVRFSGFPKNGVKAIDAFSLEKVTAPVNGALEFNMTALGVTGFCFSAAD